MPEPSRQLAAIMFTDIVGYTALMGSDEQKAMQLLEQNRNLQKPLIEQFRGKYLKDIGDATLASFASAGDAVGCALAIQNALSDDREVTPNRVFCACVGGDNALLDCLDSRTNLSRKNRFLFSRGKI